MTDEKKIPKPARTSVVAAAALALGLAGGAGAQRAANPPHEVQAKPIALRILGDGQLAIGIEVSVGAAIAGREIVCNADASNPRLNGTPIADSPAAELCKAAHQFATSAGSSTESLSDRLSRP